MGEQMTRQVLVVGSAPQDSCDNLWRYPIQNAWVIAADGGRRTAEQLGLTVRWYVGDGDSGGCAEGVPGTVLPAEKDLTDLEAAIQFALERGCPTLYLWGVSGGRADHHLANLHLLEQIKRADTEGILLDPVNEVRCLLPGRYDISNHPPYRYLGLIPLDSRLTGVSLQGVKYPLSNATLSRGSTLTVSNEILPGKNATISIETGTALLVRSIPLFK